MFFKTLTICIFTLSCLFAKDPPQIILGNPDAKTEVVVYTALTCAACAFLHKDTLKKYEKTRDFRIVIRHYPLDAQSLEAAVAVECALANRKVEFYEEIFNRQNELFEKSNNLRSVFDRISSDLKIPLDCSKTENVKQDILENYKLIENLIEETPTFFVGPSDVPLEKRRKGAGALSAEEFDKFLRKP